MASPKVFARRILRRARQVEIGGLEALRATAVVVNQTVVLTTPVKFGHARANWQIGIDTSITEEIDENDISGAATISRNNGTIRSSTPQKIIVLSNNVPYIQQLNEGSSSQAPAMFVQIAILQAITAVKRTRFFK